MSPADGGVGIELETIERAPQTQRWEGPTSAPTQEALLTQLSGLVRRASALTDADRRKRIEARYQELLTEFNEIGAAGGDASALADELRTREGFLNRLAHVERRLIGLQDPHGTGEFVFSATPEERKAKLHWWSGVAGQIAGQLTWLEVQSEALAAEEPHGGALVIVGLAGPYHRLLARWERWLAGLGGVLDLECVFSYRTRDGWVGDISRPKRADAITAFAASSAVPGAGSLFEALAGLTWNPVPPSHGQPALVAARAEQFSTGSAAELLAWVRDHRRAETNAVIEFEEADGVFTEVRSGRSWTIPEDRSSNLGDFMASVLVHRLSPEADDG